MLMNFRKFTYAISDLTRSVQLWLVCQKSLSYVPHGSEQCTQKAYLDSITMKNIGVKNAIHKKPYEFFTSKLEEESNASRKIF